MSKKAAAGAPTLFAETEPAKPDTGLVRQPRKTTQQQRQERDRSAVAKVERFSAPMRAEPQNLLASLFQAISNPRINPEKLHALIDARERLMREHAHVEFMTAYIEMQSEMPSISKDGKIDQGTTQARQRQGVKARYATYENINAVTKPILAKHRFGMLLLPDVTPEGGIMLRGQLGFVCDTPYGKLVHVERCAITSPPELSGAKNASQGVGSALSYLKRFGQVALLNLVTHAPEDADRDAMPKAGRTTTVIDADEKLTAEQVKTLKAAIEFCGATEKNFCTGYAIAKVEDLPPKFFNEAMQACQNYKAKREADRGEESRRA